MLMVHHKFRGRVALLLGALMPLLLLTPLAATGAGAAPQTLTAASPAIVNAVDQACATGVFTEPNAPGVPAALVGKSVQTGGCSSFAATSAVANARVRPLVGEPGGYCTAGSSGYDNGYNTVETGYTLQSCTADVYSLEAWNDDFYKLDGVTGWNTKCSNYSPQLGSTSNDSFCDDPGSWYGTYWRVEGQSEIILPSGYDWISVQEGCTGDGTQIEFCSIGIPGFLYYWNA